METGFKGAFVISWSQTEVDGQRITATDKIAVGSAWRWSGQLVRVDGPAELLLLGGGNGKANLRAKAAHNVCRLIGLGGASGRQDLPDSIDTDPVLGNGFVVTDGHRSFAVSLVALSDDSPPLLLFLNDIPPANTDMWVVSKTAKRPSRLPDDPASGGVICFTTGTKIRTPDGVKRIEELAEGDKIQTKDDGAQEILWIGKRRMTGARMHALPHLRPVRIRAGALAHGEPDEDLLVSPDHRLLIKGPVATALFNASEVLVAAKDLINDRDVLVDHSVRETEYVHLLLSHHQVVWANGVETESFHPAGTKLDAIAPDQRARLLDLYPKLQNDPHSYGAYVRRNLSPSEAEIMKYDSVIHH
ncbi:MAG: hemolysin-type calcium-binding protein [Rhodobacterales bacterium]|nr:MAG: hemolysin-type calcium-binding protein [Rhodobacterales bacterium]